MEATYPSPRRKNDPRRLSKEIFLLSQNLGSCAGLGSEVIGTFTAYSNSRLSFTAIILQKIAIHRKTTIPLLIQMTAEKLCSIPVIKTI